jgi:sugar lactone lactonase YvrE
MSDALQFFGTSVFLFLSFLLRAMACADDAVPVDYVVEVFAGTGEAGYSGDGGDARAAQLNNPFGIVRGPGTGKGPERALYICDTGNHLVRKVSANGRISTVAGTGKPGYAGDGGQATAALLNEPYEVRFDRAGDLYFVEMQNHVVRKVDMKSGVISTLAGTGTAGFSGDGGAAVAAQLNQPHSIQFSPVGVNEEFVELFLCDIGNHRLRAIDLKSGMIRTVAGTGEKKTGDDGAAFAGAPLNGPRAIDFSPSSSSDGDAWLALREGNAVYRLDRKAGTMHHVAGTGDKGFTGNGGVAKVATLSGPKGVSIGPDGNVYLADTESHSVRMIDRSVDPPVLRLIAGTGERGKGKPGPALECTMARPHGIFVDGDGAIYVGDTENHRVWVLRQSAAGK